MAFDIKKYVYIFLMIVYLLLVGLSSASIYFIYDEIKGVTWKDAPILGKVVGKITDQLVSHLVSFYGMIAITSLFLVILVYKNDSVFESQILTLNHLLFFYSIITLLPAGSIVEDIPSTLTALSLLVGTSILTMIVSVFVVIYYNYDKFFKKKITSPGPARPSQKTEKPSQKTEKPSQKTEKPSRRQFEENVRKAAKAKLNKLRESIGVMTGQNGK